MLPVAVLFRIRYVLLYAYYLPTTPLLSTYFFCRDIIGTRRPPPARYGALQRYICGGLLSGASLSKFLTPHTQLIT
jgi:hypothetical protein